MRTRRLTYRGCSELVSKGQRSANLDVSESGVYAVVVVLLATLLLGLSALAVDLANARMIRTQAQNTVDSAVLAAAQDLPNKAEVLSTVKTYALDNFKLPASAWAGCIDEGALPFLIDTDTTNRCITTNSATNPTKLRVRLPITKMKTSFGRSIGVENVKIRASAEAEVLLGRNDRIFPTAISGAAGNGLTCMEAGGGGACPTTQTGNFGSIESPRLNIHRTSGTHDTLRINYALGIDHSLVTDAAPDKVCDGGPTTAPAPCTLTNSTNSSLGANHLWFVHGNGPVLTTDGLVDGGVITTSDDGSGVPYCGRLERPARTPDNIAQLMPSEGCVATPPTMTVSNSVINGHHIYMWMTPAARAYFYPEIPINSNLALTSSLYNPGDVRLDCFLSAYTSTFTPTTCRPLMPVLSLPAIPIFTEGLVTDPRYGVVPTICEIPEGSTCGGLPNGNRRAVIKDFKGSFIYDLNTNGPMVQSFNGWIFELSLVEPNTTLLTSGTNPVVQLSK
jgi:Putative Flp pilus-assembly TadE/G-like